MIAVAFTLLAVVAVPLIFARLLLGKFSPAGAAVMDRTFSSVGRASFYGFLLLGGGFFAYHIAKAAWPELPI